MKTVIGLFDSAADAQSAVQDLISRGWTREAIGIAVSSPANDADVPEHLAVKDAEKGAVVGGLAGLLLGLSELAVPGVGPILAGGWLVTTLLGTGVGVATGGLVGALIDAGISHQEAGHLEEGVRRGGTLVTVQADPERASTVMNVLQSHHAVDIHERAARWQQAG